MDTQVWTKLAKEFEAKLSFYNSSPDEIDIALLRPHMKKAGRAYFEFLQNEEPDITTTGEFLVEPVVRDVIDSSGREHSFTDAYDLYWLCVLGLFGRCGYITVRNKKLREMKIPTVSTTHGTEADWSAYFLHGIGPEEGFLLNERDYVIDVCESSIQACKFFIDEYYGVTEEMEETEQKRNDEQGNGGQADSPNEKTSPEDKSGSKGTQNIHIKHFQGIIGDVRAENVQAGDKNLIHKHSETEKKKKGILRNLWWIITAIIGFWGSLLGVLNHLGWLESVKLFFYKLFTHK